MMRSNATKTNVFTITSDSSNDILTLPTDGDLSLSNSTTLTHSPATSAAVYTLTVTAHAVAIDATSRIDVSARGHRGGLNGSTEYQGRWLHNWWVADVPYSAGGSYGGLGGRGDLDPNTVYGSIYQPVDPGAGGGTKWADSPGGNGGGALALDLDELALDGTLRANGQDGVNLGSGGSGGSVYVKTKKLSGLGLVEAKGGSNANTSYPSGSGGRVALYYDTLLGFDLTRIKACGGVSGAGTSAVTNGGAGTVYLKSSLASTGEIRIDNNGVSSSGGTPLAAPSGSITALSAQLLEDSNAQFLDGSLVGMLLYPKKTEALRYRVVSNTATQLYTDPADGDMTQIASVGDLYDLRHNANVNVVRAQMSVTGVARYPGLILTDSTAKVTGSLVVPSLNLAGSTLTMNGSLLVDGDLNLSNGATLTHNPATSESEYKLYVKAARVAIDSTSHIDVSTRGYRGGSDGTDEDHSGRMVNNMLVASQGYPAGGSFGGRGGKIDLDSNPVYGSAVAPFDLGAGGSTDRDGDPAGSGGGAVRLEADDLTVNGDIRANGQDRASSSGTGAGGSVYLRVKRIFGTGLIQANGGAAGLADAPSGSGGRVALYYDEPTAFDLSKITAFGGKSGGSAPEAGSNPLANGGAGTVYVKPSYAMGELLLWAAGNRTTSRTILPEIRESTVTSTDGSVLTDLGTWWMPKSLIGMKLVPDAGNPEQTFRILDNDFNTITVEGTLPAGLADKRYYGKYFVDGRLRVRDTATLEMNGGVEATEIVLENNTVLAHSSATPGAEYNLYLKATAVSIDNTSRLDVSECGYRGGANGVPEWSGRWYTNGLITDHGYAAGGSYGGSGGTGDSPPNEVYGSLYEPTEPGAGGGSPDGCPAGNGGGALRVDADSLVNNGAIRANGQGSNCAAGAGSGGSVYLRVQSLSGTGTVWANGGANTSGTNSPAGGGGRVAVYYDLLDGFDLGKVAAIGGKAGAGTNGGTNGGAGTVYLKLSTATFGNLLVDNKNLLTTGWSTPLFSIDVGRLSTGLEPNRLIDTNACYPARWLIGMKLRPDATKTNVFTIASDSCNDLLTVPGDGDMTLVAWPGAEYRAEHHLFNLSVLNKARLYTTDRVVLNGSLTVSPGSAIHTAEFEQ